MGGEQGGGGGVSVGGGGYLANEKPKKVAIIFV